MTKPIKWLASTVGKRGYIARYLRDSSPAGSVVFGTGNEKYTPGFMSCDTSFIVPSITAPDYLDAVIALSKREGFDAAVCLSDLDIAVLSKARDKMTEMGIACFFPGYEVAMRYLDKIQAAEFFRKNGFLTPKTFDSLEDAFEGLSFPIVIKPSKGSASSGLKICENEKEAVDHWNSIGCPMAQEFIEGRLVNVEACSDTDGRPIAVSAWDRKASVAGETLLTETVAHEKGIEKVLSLLDASPIPGPIDVDFIEANDELYFIEINTRFGGGYPGSHLAGADFPGAMIASMHGETTELVKYKAGVTMVKELTPVVFDEGMVKEAHCQ